MMVVATFLAGRGVRAQAARAFSVYIDCSGFRCESAFYRTDITFVDHVRERSAADVHILITRQTTGGGGRVYTLAFYGQHAFEKLSDTLTVETAQGATEDEQRQAISRTIKLGLTRYVARTPAAARASLSVAAPTDTDAATPPRDRWNAWVFRIGANVNAPRERSFSGDYVFGNVSAARVTERWKTNIRVNENYNGQTFKTDSGAVTSVKRDYGGSVQQVRSLGRRWAAGLTGSAASSTFLNEHLVASVAPAVEYNFFPYSESTRHALLVRYSVGERYLLYNDTTIYFKTSETRPYEALSAGLAENQRWGTLQFEVNGYHFLDDISKSRLNFSAETDVRLFRGLSLTLFGNYSVLHDQIYLSKTGLSDRDLLLRQSQLATSYSAHVFAGLNYTFGSVRNNVVNPRFTSVMSEF